MKTCILCEHMSLNHYLHRDGLHCIICECVIPNKDIDDALKETADVS